MTIRKVLWIHGDGVAPTYAAEDDRSLVVAALGGGIVDTAMSPGVGAVGRGHGVISGFGVTPNGTPNNTVKVATGMAGVRGTQVNDQGLYVVRNDAEVTLNVAAADGTNARRDLVILTVRDDEYPAFTQDDAILDIIEGPADGSLADPTVPEDTLVLARLVIGAGAGGDVISSGDIGPLAPQVRASGGITPVSSLAAWPSPTEGDAVYRTDVDRLAFHTGAAWRHIGLDYTASGTLADTAGGGTSDTGTISFGVTFAAAPAVVATIQSATGAPLIVGWTAAPSTTGVNFRVAGRDPGDTFSNYTIHWFARGPLAA